MANFKFQNFWPKKMDFFVMERPFYPVQSSNFVGMLEIYPNPDDKNLKKIHCATQKLVFISKLKIRVGCHGH